MLLLISAGAYADICLVAVMILFIAVGVAKGFIKSILSFFGTIFALVIAYLFCKQFGSFLSDKFALYEKLCAVVEKSLLKNPKFAIEMSSATLQSSLEQAGLPKFLTSVILTLPVVVNNTYPAGTTLASLVAPVLANYLLIAISFVLLFLLIKIILIVLKRIAAEIKKIKILDTVDKVLGLLVGAIQGIIFVYVAFTIFSLFPSVFAKPLNAINQSTISSYVYNTDIIGKSFAKLISKNDLNDKVNDYLNENEENYIIRSYTINANLVFKG